MRLYRKEKVRTLPPHKITLYSKGEKEMKIRLPVQEKEIVNGEKVVRRSEKVFDIDTSLVSEMRWEAKFPEQAKNEDLFTYTQRMAEQKTLTAPVIIGKIKAVYCWYETDLSFIEFLRMFDLSDGDYMKELLDGITRAWELIRDGSTEKN